MPQTCVLQRFQKLFIQKLHSVCKQHFAFLKRCSSKACATQPSWSRCAFAVARLCCNLFQNLFGAGACIFLFGCFSIQACNANCISHANGYLSCAFIYLPCLNIRVVAFQISSCVRTLGATWPQKAWQATSVMGQHCPRRVREGGWLIFELVFPAHAQSQKGLVPCSPPIHT